MYLQVREVGDGNINYVYIVEGPSGAVVLKQGLPYIRIAHDWPLTQVCMKGLYLMTSLLGTHSRACEHSSSQHQVLTLLAGGSARHHSPALCVQQALDDQFQKTDCQALSAGESTL